MTKSKIMLSVILAFATITCSDEPSQADTGSSQDSGNDLADVESDSGDVAQDGGELIPASACPVNGGNPLGSSLEPEGLGPDNDYPDCITGCAHDPNPPIWELATFTRDGFSGVIDSGSHEYTSAGLANGPDIDIIGIRVPVRTQIEVIVSAPEGSALNPVLNLHSGTQLLTFADDANSSTTTARAVLTGQTVNELPIYIIVTDKFNYENFSPNTDAFVGGEDYRYQIQVNTSALDLTNLGTVSPEAPILSTGQVNCPGDMLYYSFQTTSTTTPIVTISRTGSADFDPLVIAHESLGGDFTWSANRHDEDNDGTTSLSGDLFQAGTEYIFAVTDYNGNGQPGEGGFSFDIMITQ